MMQAGKVYTNVYDNADYFCVGPGIDGRYVIQSMADARTIAHVSASGLNPPMWIHLTPKKEQEPEKEPDKEPDSKELVGRRYDNLHSGARCLVEGSQSGGRVKINGHWLSWIEFTTYWKAVD